MEFKDSLVNALTELNKAYKALSFYPSGHPALSHFIENAYASIQKLGEAKGHFSIKVGRSGFFFQGKPIGHESPSIKGFAFELHRRKVQEVSFTRMVRNDEVNTFLRLIAMEPGLLEGKGGIKKGLLDEGVEHIRVEEVDPAKWLKSQTFSIRGKDGLGKEKGKGDFPISEGTGTGESWGMASGLEGQKGVPSLRESSRGEGISPIGSPRIIDDVLSEAETRLQDLERASGLQEYQPIAKELEEISRRAIRLNLVDDFLKIMMTFLRHARPESQKPPELKEWAAKEVEEILDREELYLLINRLCEKEGYKEEEIVDLLLAKGRPAVSALLQRLVEEGDISARRRLIGALIAFGEMAVPYVVEMLNDERWYVVRNMATILTEIGGPEEVQALGEFLHHEEPRVRREVLRALTKIKGHQAASMVLEALYDDDEGVRRQAILSVGSLKEVKAIPYLMELVKRKGVSEKELSLKKEAILAIGNIGADATVPALSGILLKERWFNRRRHDELRIAVVAALKAIGTKHAIETIKLGLNARSRTVREACRSALTGTL